MFPQYCVKSSWNRGVSLAHYFVSQGMIFTIYVVKHAEGPMAINIGLTAFALILIINVATAIAFFK